MTHVWNEDKDFKLHDGFYKRFTCSRCGAIKTKHRMRVHGRSYFDYYYERSGVVSDFNYIECLDWNDNSLDEETYFIDY